MASSPSETEVYVHSKARHLVYGQPYFVKTMEILGACVFGDKREKMLTVPARVL